MSIPTSLCLHMPSSKHRTVSCGWRRPTDSIASMDSITTRSTVSLLTRRVSWIDPIHPETVHRVAIPESFEELVAAGPDKIWAADEEKAVLLDHGRAVETLERQRSHERDRPGPLLVGRGGRLWFLGETVR